MEKLGFNWKGKSFKIRCKLSYLEKEGTQKIVNVKPEFDDLQQVSLELEVPIRILRIKVMEQISGKYF